MNFTEWLLFFLLIQVLHFLGTWKLYVKAGRKAWEAAIPIYNGLVLLQIIKRPKWWILLFFIPVVNLLMFPVIWIETIRTFGFFKKVDSFLVLVTLGLYIFYVNYAGDANYNPERSLKPRSELGEWVSSITFAIIAATLVHTYFMQPFTIPTSSLEKSLLVGDYLFVSKFHYGARVPSSVISLPMVHDSIPLTKLPSYLKKPQLPYTRLPGLQKIKNNDIVCFNWPADSLATMWGDNSGKFTYKPVDKKTNYVKRSVGIAGDSLEIRDGYVYLNGKKNELPSRAKIQFYYTYEAKSTINGSNFPQFLIEKERIGVYKILSEYWNNAKVQKAIKKNGNFARRLKMESVPNKININLTAQEVLKLKKYKETVSVRKLNFNADNAIFPHIKSNNWSQDNFGPIYIPKAGVTVKLDLTSLPYYKQIIQNYENNDLAVVGSTIFINGIEATSYTFKQDYYWLMGDNRHNSLDARYWGYVPFDHVLGKPVMVWFSWNANAASFGEKLKSIRWDRMFTTVHGEGAPVSYRYYVLALLALYFGYSFYSGRKKKAKK